ncbi:MAG: sulfur carrier protein ThiS [Planctomycetaceae bacterium]|nr:sulfur carrier protein ThiS [Planctomycetaceae bacterium]
MNVTVNDQSQQYPNPLNIAQLLAQLGLAGRPVAVELNQDLVPKAQHEETWLKDGDHLEVVSLTGGG